jgi:hypothetical protein
MFDNSYGGHMRDFCGATGWGVANHEQMLKVLLSAYWYRKADKKFRFTDRIRKYTAERGIYAGKRAVSQSLHTINSIIIKKMMAFSPEIADYSRIADQTARAFDELLTEYCLPIQRKDGVPVEPKPGFYTELKDLCNLVKMQFHKESRADRVSWLSHEFASKALGACFGTEFRKLRSYVEGRYAESGEDYSLSPAFIFRCSTICQTRAIGYLPEAIAEYKRLCFRIAVNRPVEKPERTFLRFQYHAVQRGLHRGGVSPMFMAATGVRKDPDSVKLFQEVFNRIELPLKVSASTDQLVRDGGKLEDARLLLRKASENKWKIPVRDLDDNSIIEWIDVVRETDMDEEYTRPLFWLSYNLMINHWVKRGLWDKADYTELTENGEPYEPDVFSAKIVHISEPGKDRNLTKSSSIMAWFLTPGSKLTQGTLARLKEHRAGLLESSHEWRHQKRISVMSDESSFIYDSRTGKTDPAVRHIFKDWQESTDFIPKLVGWAHLKGLFEYVGFPRAYAKMILITIIEPQPVSEVLIIRDNVLDEPERVSWTGFIREGFMMGNPMTKTILHLVHTSELELALEFLRRNGADFKQPVKAAVVGQSARIDRKEAAKATNFVV